MNIKPLGDRVVIKRPEQEKEQKLSSGIYIAAQEDKKDINQGEVVAVGPGSKKDDGTIVPLEIEKGDTVIFSWGEKVKLGDEEYEIVSASNILAVLE